MKTIILCGGRGTRMQEETEVRPKPLIEVGGLPVLVHIMKIYAHYGFNEFILCLGYKGYMIKDFFLDYEKKLNDFTLNLREQSIVHHTRKGDAFSITFAETGLNTNTGGRVKRIEKYINEDNFFLTYGDGVGDINLQELLKYHLNHNKIGTVTAVHPPPRFGAMEIEEETNRVTDFSKRKLPPGRGRIDGGFMVFKKDFFDYLSPNEECFLEQEPLKNLAAQDQFMAYKHDGFWQCMDVQREVEYLNSLWKTNNAPWKVWRD